MSLPDVLQWIGQSCKTGTLLIDNGECTRRFEIDTGTVTGISSSKAPALLGLSLVDQGLITSSVLHHAVALQKQEAKACLLGRVLVDIGAISETEVERTLREKIQENVLDLLETPVGGFQFVEHESSPRQRVPVQFNINDLLLTSVHVLDEARAEGAKPAPAPPLEQTPGLPKHPSNATNSRVEPTPVALGHPPETPRPESSSGGITGPELTAVTEQEAEDRDSFGPILLQGGGEQPTGSPGYRRGLILGIAAAGIAGAVGFGTWLSNKSSDEVSFEAGGLAEESPDSLSAPAEPNKSSRIPGHQNGSNTNRTPASAEDDRDDRKLEESRFGSQAISTLNGEAAPAPMGGLPTLPSPRDAESGESTRLSGMNPTRSRGEDSTRAQDDPAIQGSHEQSNPTVPSQPARAQQMPPAVVHPVLVVPPRVKYPARALRLKQDAVVMLSVKVSAAGRVVDVESEPDQGVSPDFVAAAIEAAYGARYQPATREGKPLEFWTPLRIAFELK